MLHALSLLPEGIDSGREHASCGCCQHGVPADIAWYAEAGCGHVQAWAARTRARRKKRRRRQMRSSTLWGSRRARCRLMAARQTQPPPLPLPRLLPSRRPRARLRRAPLPPSAPAAQPRRQPPLRREPLLPCTIPCTSLLTLSFLTSCAQTTESSCACQVAQGGDALRHLGDRITCLLGRPLLQRVLLGRCRATGKPGAAARPASGGLTGQLFTRTHACPCPLEVPAPHHVHTPFAHACAFGGARCRRSCLPARGRSI